MGAERGSASAGKPVLEHALDVPVEGVEAIQRDRLGRGEAPAWRLLGAVVAEDAVQEREAALVVELGGAVGEDPLADLDVAEQASLVGEAELGAVGVLLGPAEVVDDGGGEEQVGVELGMQLAEVVGKRGDRDGVLEQAAEVGVMAGAGAGRPAPGGPERLIDEQRIEQCAVAAVEDLGDEMLEEAVELVEVAVGGGQEVGRIGLAVGGARDLRHLEHEIVAEALDAAGDADEVAALEAAGQGVGVLEGAGGHNRGAIAELEGQVGGPGTGREAVLARAGEHAVDALAGAQSAEQNRGRIGRTHTPMMYGGSDAATAMGAPPRW